MKTVKFKTITAILIALLLSVNTNIFAQSGKKDSHDVEKHKKFSHGVEKHHDGMGFLNLTDEQKSQIKKLKTANMKEMLPLKNQIAEKKAHLRTLTTADNVDMIAVNKTIDEIVSIKATMMKKHAAHKQEMRKLLNDEQRIHFDMKMSKHKGHEFGKKGCHEMKTLQRHGQEH